MTRKWWWYTVPILAVGLWAVTDIACYAGGVPTGAHSRYGTNYASAPNYYSGFFWRGPAYAGGYYTPSSPVVVYVGGYYAPYYAAAPERSSSPAEASGEEQEEPSYDPATATLAVRVPVNAEIWFEGDRTSQTGPDRRFVSPVLTPGKTFTYSIRAHWTSPTGQVVDATREVKVRAGRRIVVNFLGP
jgi:uncharacterized protein (TIGR03000 family)